MATIKVSDDSFSADVLNSDVPVLVDFWAEWCAPCKQIGPALEEVSDEFSGKLTVAKINIDDDPETPSQFHIRSIPTLMIFKGGEVVATLNGAVTKTKMVDWINASI